MNTKMLRLLWRVGGLFALLVTVAGCSKKLPANPKVYLVAGKVTLNGEPVRGGAVHFDCAESSSYDGSGTIGANGTYSAGAFVGQKGLVPGEYKVWIEPYARGVHGPLEGAPTTIPSQYQSPSSSGLTYAVKSEENTFNIELKN
jgi:hypothetical protein